MLSCARTLNVTLCHRFVSRRKQGLEIDVVVLHRFLEHFCPKQGQDFKPQAGAMYPNMGKVPPGVPTSKINECG